jgi:hypothetical protein
MSPIRIRLDDTSTICVQIVQGYGWAYKSVNEFQIGADSYRTGNRRISKSYADPYADLYVDSYVHTDPYKENVVTSMDI